MHMNNSRVKIIFSILAVALLVPGSLGTLSACTTQSRLIMATTTSLYDTGLWGYLELMFEEEYDVELEGSPVSVETKFITHHVLIGLSYSF